MGTISPASPDRMYPWWWDSHINPKNSKWLHENVTDMDAKVKQMIKLIEEDADSFARRAEMYYKKRPELMKLVEEFYRAYRALAGRYDHVAGVLRQAHRTVAEVFPNQVPFALVDELPAGLGGEAYPGSLRMPQIFLPFDLGELGKDASQISNDLTGSGEGPKLAKSSERRARKSLNFRDAETIRNGEEKSAVDNPEVQVPSESERMGKAELEILTLKTVLSSLEAEKQAGLLQYQQSLERLSNLEVEVSRAKEDSNGLNERASKAEAEVNTLKESLEKLDAERHASFLQYQLCVEKISNFENYISRAENDAGQLNERASKAETEAQTLSHDLTKLEDEKESSLDLYNQWLEKISDMEGKLLQAKEAARRSNDRADTADKEVEALMQALAMLVDEKEGAAVKYNNCLETVALLEHRLKVAEEDAKRLNSKIDDGVAKFKSAEERCLQLERSNQMLHSDMETSAQKMAAQNEELTEKQKELSRIWTCLQEERLRYVETQNAFQSLERSNSQSQEELRSLTVEIRKREGTIEELKAANKGLLAEVEQIKVENKGLNEVNLSLALTVKDLKAEVSCSRETIRKLEAEVELRVNQRNALQQEVYGMTEDLKPLNMKHQAFSAQVESLGICSNTILEDSLSDRNMELDVVRDKVKALEESIKLLRDENSALISNKAILASQLHKVSDNLDKLSEEKSYLENSLNAAYSELEEWREKSRCVEESCHLLEKRNCSIDGESDQLRDKVVTLDVQNKELKSQIAEYAKAIKYLRDFVTTLESRAVVDASHQGDNKEAKEARRDMALAVCGDIHLEMVEESRSMLLGEYADLNDLQRRTRTVEKLITEREKHLLLENSATKSKLEAAMKQLEDLKSKRNLRRLHTTKARHINARLENDDLKPQATHEISEEGSEIMTKDIMLDGSSECSSIGFSRTSTVETNDPLEFWEAAFHEGSIDLTVEKAPKMQRTRSEKKQQRDQHQRRRTQSFVDKEVSVDNLEVPRRIPAPCHDANERKVLERLDSDAQKLTNLHITVQDLKKTVEVTEKMRRGTTTTGIEYGNVKEQLEESEEAVIKLFNLNLRLKRNFEDESFPLEETSALAFEEKKSIRRRKVTEQARRMSDKIGRLQLEVQKLQFLLMKLEDESKPRQKIKITERKTRVLLRDYLYTSGTRATRQRPKRGNLCACAQPSTKGD